MQWLIAFWTSFVAMKPHQQDVRDRVAALPALPESARMTHGRKIHPKPKSIEQWYRLHGRRAS